MHSGTKGLVVGLCLLFAWRAAAGDSAPLPRDPKIVYGQFDNGFNYIIRKNINPPGRIAFYLHVKTGALNETDQQNGLAHFLEHMCFNGSASFPPGELIPHMNKMGMTFGAHSNAHTIFHETVYKLLMPSNTPEVIDTAFTIFSDWANGLLLLDEEINNERGVVLEEKRAGKGAAERIFDLFRKHVFAGSRLEIHDVIGDEKQIEKFSRSEFLDYWNTWYRPEHMTLIIAGSMDPEEMVKRAKEKFGSFQARAPARQPRSAEIRFNGAPRGIALTDKEQVAGQVQALVLRPPRAALKSEEDYCRLQLEEMGAWIVRRRLDEMVKKDEASFRQSQVGVSNFFNEALIASATVYGEPEEWRRMLEQLVVEIHRACEHGFNENEVLLARKNLLANAERAVEIEQTLDNAAWVNRYSRLIGMNEPLMSAEQRLDLVKKFLENVSAERIQEVFAGHFKDSVYSYVLTLPEEKPGFTAPAPEEILATASAAWSQSTSPLKPEVMVESILAELPKPGTVAAQTTDESLGITTARLDNGAVVHHRYMNYKREQALVSIMLAGGEIEETAENRGISQVAKLVNSTSRANSTDVRDLMVGKKVTVSANATLDTVTFTIDGSPNDLEDGFQVVYGYLTDGRIEKSALENWKKERRDEITWMKTNPFGQIKWAMDEVLMGGDVRLSTLSEEQVEKLTAPEGERWMRRLCENAPLEVAIVGDIPLEKALDLAARYVGALPSRPKGFDGLDGLRKLKRSAGPYEKTIVFETITPKAAGVAGFIGADEGAFLDHHMLTMAARILSDRMIQRIREQERLVYGISAGHQPGRGMPGLGLMVAGAPCDPQNAEKLADTVLEMFGEFAKDGPTVEEVDTALKQLNNRLETDMKEPSFWLNNLGQLEYRKHTLDELKQLPTLYSTFTAEQLRDVTKKYLRSDAIVRLVAKPAPTEAPVGPEQEKKAPSGTQ